MGVALVVMLESGLLLLPDPLNASCSRGLSLGEFSDLDLGKKCLILGYMRFLEVSDSTSRGRTSPDLPITLAS